MKRIPLLTPVALVLSLLAAAPASAGFWDNIATAGWKDFDPLDKFRVNTFGSDVRVYEFQSRVDPHKSCVMAFSEGSGAVGLDCDVNPDIVFNEDLQQKMDRAKR